MVSVFVTESELVHGVQEAKDAAAAAVKAQEEEQRQKDAEAARQQEEVAQNQRAMEEQKAKDLAQLEASSVSSQSDLTSSDLHFWRTGMEVHALRRHCVNSTVQQSSAQHVPGIAYCHSRGSWKQHGLLPHDILLSCMS